jgi:hypothetical protein
LAGSRYGKFDHRAYRAADSEVFVATAGASSDTSSALPFSGE